MDMSMKSMIVSLMVMMSIINLTKAQSSVASCTQSLIPCAEYLNSTKPPSSCCGPLKEAFATQLQCLCTIFNTPGLLESFNVNATEALGLGRHCGITNELSSCTAGSAPSPSSSSAPPPAEPTPSPSPSSPSVPAPATRGAHSGADRVSFTEIYFLILFWAPMLF